MDRLVQLIISTAVTLFSCIVFIISFEMRTKISKLPGVSYDRRILMTGIYIVGFIVLEATSVIYIYHLSQVSYMFVALFLIGAILLISFVSRRAYKREHPQEPSNIKRSPFREAYRRANLSTDPVDLTFGIAFVLALIVSLVFQQPNILSFATPLVIGPWAIYSGRKMLQRGQEEQQLNASIHWYTQYKILFGIATFFLLPYDIIERGPFTFMQTYPYANQLEDVFASIALIFLLASGFFFFRRQYLKRRGRVS